MVLGDLQLCALLLAVRSCACWHYFIHLTAVRKIVFISTSYLCWYIFLSWTRTSSGVFPRLHMCRTISYLRAPSWCTFRRMHSDKTGESREIPLYLNLPRLRTSIRSETALRLPGYQPLVWLNYDPSDTSTCRTTWERYYLWIGPKLMRCHKFPGSSIIASPVMESFDNFEDLRILIHYRWACFLYHFHW